MPPRPPLSSIRSRPGWLTRLLQWVPVEAGIYRLNRVTHPEEVEIACPPRDESELPQTHVGYE